MVKVRRGAVKRTRIKGTTVKMMRRSWWMKLIRF